MEIQYFFEADIVAGYNIGTLDAKFIQEYYGRMGSLYSLLASWTVLQWHASTVQTNCGSIYYGIRNNLWGVKDIDINMLDITWLESEAYHITGSASQTKFSKFRGDLSV